MSTKEEKLENLKQNINALLIPYKNGCTIKQLTDDYYEIQGESIPFQQFGSGSLLNFLRTMHETIFIEFNSGRHIIKCKASEKTAHIRALVEGQKAIPKKGRVVRKQFRPSNFYPNVPIQPVHIPVEVLSAIVDLVAKHPRGINKIEIIKLIHNKMRNTYINMQDLDEQLKQISHRIYSRGPILYPIITETQPPLLSLPPAQCQPISSNSYVGGCDEPQDFCNYDDDDDFQFLPGGYTSSVPEKTIPAPRISTSDSILNSLSYYPDLVVDKRMRNTSCEEENNLPETGYGSDKKYAEINANEINNIDEDDGNYLKSHNTEALINDRLRMRLQKLVQKYSDGIWCAELPDKYLEEYRVPLCYVELGFSSVREFASHLPSIFRCVSLSATGDYKLYSAKSEVSSHANDKPSVPMLLDLHGMQESLWENETDVLPSIASLTTCKELIPDNVLTIGECVALISVESLANADTSFHEVVVVEVFTPTFFWIQLRKHKKQFKKFMSELHHYYEEQGSNYVMPSVVLEKGLNCACRYGGIWHRGIIKAVNPDLQVTVFFYDYGTLKTYPASELRYLHRKFSHLAAQAVACGLINTKPYCGHKWTRSVTNLFAKKTCNIPLVATISAINEEDNSMMVTLTDTSEAEDIHINDWMVERSLALHGRMVCMKNRHFLFEYYLQCRENLRKLIDQYSEKKKAAKSNNHANHKHTVATSNCSTSENTCAAGNTKQISTTKPVSIGLKNRLSTLSSKSKIYRSGTDLSGTSSNNTTANKNVYTKNSSSSSISSNSNLPKKPSTRYEKLLSILELSAKSKNSSSSKSTTSAEENSPREKPSDSGNNGLTRESHGKQCDLLKLKSSLNDYTTRINLYPPNIPKTDSDEYDIQAIACPGTCGGKCSKGHQVEPFDWSKFLQNSEENGKVKSVAAPTVVESKKDQEKSTDFNEQRKTCVPDNSVLHTVRTTSHAASTGGNIYWTTSGNISNNDGDKSTVLRNIRNSINNFGGNHIAVSQELLERLSIHTDIQESSTSKSATSNDVEKQTDGSEKSSAEEISSSSGEFDISYKRMSNSQGTESGNLSECNDSASSRPPNIKHNRNKNISGEVETNESCNSVSADSSLSSSSISTGRLGLLPAIISDKPVAPDTSSSESQEDSKDFVNTNLSNELEQVQRPNQNLNNDFYAKPNTCTNYYMHLQAKNAKLRILKMLMKKHNPPKQCDSLDSDDCSVSDYGEVTTESVQQVEEVRQENPCEISKCKVQEVACNSVEDADGEECDNQTEITPEEKFDAQTDRVTEKESDKIQEEALDGSEITNITDSTSVTTEDSHDISVGIPMFNDLDMETDIEEWDVQVQLPDICRDESTVDSVEMKDLLLYVEENLLFSPERCFEDESILSQKNQASDDKPITDPLIQIKNTLLDNIRIPAPPGFSVPGKPISLETIMEEQAQSFPPNSVDTNVPPVNTGSNNNPFVQESVHSTNDQKLTTQVLIDLYNINLQLQMYITTLHTLLSTSASNPSAMDSVKAAVKALVKNAQLDSVIESISRPKGEINTPSEITSVLDHKCNTAAPTEYLHDAFSNLTVPNGTPSNFGESDTRVPKVQDLFVSSDINSHYRQSSVLINCGSESSNSPLTNYSNGIPAISNFVEHGRMSASISYDNLSDSMHTLAENFNKLSVTDSHTSTYSTTPITTFDSYLNREPRESVQLVEPPSITTSTYNPTYPNDSTNHTISNYETLNNNVIGRKETNPFKLSLAGKLHIPDSNEHCATIHYNDNSTAKQYQPVNNYGIPQPTVNGCSNVAAPKYSYQPHATEILPTIDNFNMYSPNLPHNANGHIRGTPVPRQEATYISPIGANNVWSAGNMDSHAFNGFIPGNPMYYNVPKETCTAPKEVTSEIPTSNTYARNNVMNDYLNQRILQEQTCRPTVDCSTNIFRSGKCDDMNRGNQHLNFDSNRPCEVPRTYFDRKPSQEQPVARDFDIKVAPPSSNSRMCSNGVLDRNSQHLESTGSSWSPITGFTSPLLIENLDEGYQTRPSTSTTLQNSPSLRQTFSDEESKIPYTTSESDIVNSTCVDIPMHLFGDIMTSKFESNKRESVPQTLLNTCQNETNEAPLKGPQLPSKSKTIDDNPAKKILVYNCGGNLLCRQIELRGSYVHIFHYRGDGWILLSDFVDVFTEFKSPTIIISVFHALDLDIECLELDKFNFAKIPQFNSKIRKMALDNKGIPYTRVHLVPLKDAIKVLIKWNIMTTEEINNAITKKEFTEGEITHQLWGVITAYGELLKVINNYETGEWI